MKNLKNWLIFIIIIALIGFGIYKFCFDCEHSTALFNRYFILENKMDYVTIEDEVIVKYLGLEDNRCKEEDCDRTGEFVVKVLVVNDHRFSYVKLGTLSEPRIEIEKLGYTIEVDEVTEDGKVTLKLIKSE